MVPISLKAFVSEIRPFGLPKLRGCIVPVTRLIEGRTVVDEVVTTFGIRSLSWSADRGFVLNGLPIKLHGGSVHHDNGPLGAAAFDRAESESDVPRVHNFTNG